MAMPERIRIEVVYAEPQRARIGRFELTAPARVVDALAAAAADPIFTGIDLEHASVGVFGRRCALDRLLEEGDRVEIYRPLAVDPKAARRARASEGRKPQ